MLPRLKLSCLAVMPVALVAAACFAGKALADDVVDFSHIAPPPDFVTLRDMRDELRLPPLLVQACRPQPNSENPKGGEDWLFKILARVELLRLWETDHGRALIYAAASPQSPKRVIGDFAGCLNDLAEHWAERPGAGSFGGRPHSVDTTKGWQKVADALHATPALFGVPGTDNTEVPYIDLGCERDIGAGEGDNWDVAMALMFRIWFRARGGLKRHLPQGGLDSLRDHVARVVWLQGSSSTADFFPCSSIPESENHIWLIESTRFLHNDNSDVLPLVPMQEIRTAAPPPNDDRNWISRYVPDDNGDNAANGVGQRICSMLRAIVTNDLLEYNAREYERFQMIALLNLEDFARQPEMRAAAQAALDFLSAKEATESMNGNRIAPFRRKQSNYNNEFFYGEPLTPMFQVWAGNIAPYSVVTGIPGAIQEMTLASSTEYRPPDVLVDVMLNSEHHHYLQQFDGRWQLERAYGARDFTLSGGGTATDCPYPSPYSWPIPHCPGAANDPGAVMPIVLIPRMPRDSSGAILSVDLVLHSGPFEFNTASHVPSLSCIGRAVACGPSFELGTDRPTAVKSPYEPGSAEPSCWVDAMVGDDHVQAARFDGYCVPGTQEAEKLRYRSTCFFVYIRQLPSWHGGVTQPPLAYLVTHECSTHSSNDQRRREFDQFVAFLTSGPGAPRLETPRADTVGLLPPLPESCTSPPFSGGVFCGQRVAFTLPREDGPITADRDVTVSVDGGGTEYTLSSLADDRGASAAGSVATVAPAAFSVERTHPVVLALNDAGAGERVVERADGGVVVDARDAPVSFAWSATLSQEGLVTGQIEAAPNPDFLRTVTIDVDDATAYGQGCTLSNGLQGCHSRPCFVESCDNGPQTHHWQKVFGITLRPGETRATRLPNVLAFSDTNVRVAGLDQQHDYWIRACLTWYRFDTAADGSSAPADAHPSCDTLITAPQCQSVVCSAGRRNPGDGSVTHVPAWDLGTHTGPYHHP